MRIARHPVFRKTSLLGIHHPLKHWGPRRPGESRCEDTQILGQVKGFFNHVVLVFINPVLHHGVPRETGDKINKCWGNQRF